MPNSNRWKIKQELETALCNIQKAQDRITLTAQPFREIHPEYFGAFCDIVASLERAKEFLSVISAKI